MIEETENALVFRLSEDLVAERCASLRTALLERIDTDHALIIDLAAVALIDSAGLGVLISAQNTLASRDRCLTLRGVNANIAEMMKLMRLDRHFHIEP